MSLEPFTGHPWPEASLAAPIDQSLVEIDEGRALAQAIVDTIREPLLVLDRDLRVVLASRSFYKIFRVNRQDVQGRPVHALGDGQWDIPELRALLDSIIRQHTVMEAYEVTRDFSAIGRRTMLLNARKLFYRDNTHTTILLAFEDVTERRAAEREMIDLLQQKETLLEEMQHRVANSLQIIASILLLKARTVQSEETRRHLQDAHQRVMSVATMQQQLQQSKTGDLIELGPYLTRLCETLAASMIGDTRTIALKVQVERGTASSSQAVSLGLIVTELVINALKHAFPSEQVDGRVVVAYDSAEPNWRLSVSDNGIGRPIGHPDKTSPGLGTSIIEALARQLGAGVGVLMDPQGTTVSITHATFASPSPTAV
ncbi:sensor histidine kinase [Phreatobacter stygius]|uniref:histidine kinase n=1 Tax=Phreatobacter stygius TaxID=1940610 RepID=A0A4D7AUM4_9HYPH|nr:histidine kinase dimerization/phosphoacceptor domain -containing protein [Phreatobacter stygius]QCI63371.1 PAS domain-containing protein [Phreatobacter stygius]